MPSSVSPNKSNILQTLRAFLIGILPAGVSVVQAAQNRTAEPQADFIVMTSIRHPRLATNIDNWADVLFTGSIAGNVLTVSGVNFGTLIPPTTLFGLNLTTGVIIQSQLSGTPGGVGTYQLSQAQSIPSQAFAAGQIQAVQKTEIIVQLDVHGPNAEDNASIISTLIRDNYAVEQFDAITQANDFGTIEPLYAEDPKYLPFINEQQQYEYRWVVEVHLQADQVVSFPQQFASALAIELIEVDATYPP